MSRHVTIIKKVLIVLCLCLFATPAFAETVTFTKEYTYQASDFDSRHSSRTLALEMVKRLLLEELGTYLVSETEVKNMQLTKDQVTTYSAGIVGAEVIDEKWDGKAFWLKAKVSADTKEVAAAVDSLRLNLIKARELEEIKKIATKQSKEIEILKQQLDNVSDLKGKNGQHEESGKLEQYNHAINALSATDWANKGHAFSQSGKSANAIEAYGKAIKLSPESFAYYALRGSAYFENGNLRSALKDYDKAIILADSNDSGDLASLYIQRGIIYKKRGDFTQFINDLDKASNLQPDRFGPVLKSYGLKDADMDRIIKQIPNDHRGYVFRSLYYSSIYSDISIELVTRFEKHYNGIIKDCNRALKINPNSSLAHYVRGLTLRRYALYIDMVEAGYGSDNYISTLKKSLNDLNKAELLGFSRKFAQFYKIRGWVNSRLGNLNESIADYTKRINLFINEMIRGEPSPFAIVSAFKSSLAVAYFERGKVHVDAKRYSDAISDFSSAILISEEANSVLLSDSSLSDEYKRASKFSISEYYYKRGQSYYNIGNHKEAMNDYNKAIDLFHWPTYYLGRGNTQKQLGNYKEAINDFEHAIEMDKTNGSAYFNRGVAYLNSSNYPQALSDFAIAAKLGHSEAQEYLLSKGINW